MHSHPTHICSTMNGPCTVLDKGTDKSFWHLVRPNPSHLRKVGSTHWSSMSGVLSMDKDTFPEHFLSGAHTGERIRCHPGQRCLQGLRGAWSPPVKVGPTEGRLGNPSLQSTPSPFTLSKCSLDYKTEVYMNDTDL